MIKKFKDFQINEGSNNTTSEDVIERYNRKHNTNWFSNFIEFYPTYRDFQNAIADELDGDKWYDEAEFYMLENQIGEMSDNIKNSYAEFFGDMVDSEWGNDKMDDDEYDEIMNGWER